MKKIPWLAEMLNIIPFPIGLGYLYLGRPRSFAVTFLVAIGTVAVGFLLPAAVFRDVSESAALGVGYAIMVWWGLLLVLGVLPLAVGTALHAYGLAGGTARMFLSQQGKLVAVVILLGIPPALGTVLLDPKGFWCGPGYVGQVVLSPAFATDRTLFASTYDGIFRSTDAGETWQQTLGQRPLASHVVTLSPAFATDLTLFVNTSGGILRSADAGEIWRALQVPGVSSVVSSPQVPATASMLGASFLLALAGAVLVTWRGGGLGRLPTLWWRPAWAVAGLGVGLVLIRLGLVDDAMKLVYLGWATVTLLLIWFVSPMASKRLAARHQ